MKNKMLKRFLAILSVCVITVTSMPITANAATVSGNDISDEVSTDTESNEVKRSDVLSAITNSANEVVANISTTATEDLDGDTTEPIVSIPGDEENPFVQVDELSGLNAYHAVSAELTTQNVNEDTILVTKFTPSLSQSYDVVIVPGIINGKDVQYGSDFLKSITHPYASYPHYGVIFENGATLITSEPDINITYVRFESGAKAASASSTFKDWEYVTDIIGFSEALKEYGNTTVSFNNTFSGCTELGSVSLDLSDMSASFKGTFSGTSNLTTIEIKNGSITSINNIWNRAVNELYGHYYNRHSLTLSNIKFPSNDNAYLSHAFTNMWGSLIFNNCTSDDSQLLNFDEAYAGSAVPGYQSSRDTTSTSDTFEPGNSTSGNYSKFENEFIKITGIKAYSAKSMFESSGFVSVDLTGFITTDTVSVDKMFKGATFAEIKGVDSWRFGTITADEMFNSTRVYFGPKSYLTSTLIPAIKKLDWSKCTSANKLFNFTYKGNCPIDYSNMDLSGVENMTISSLSDYDFITPAKNPQNYVFEQSDVYSLRAGSALGGKALDPIVVTDGKVAGSAMPINTHIYTDIATISITDVASNKTVSTAVVPGYKLSQYLDAKIDYYQDRSLTQIVSSELIVNTGDMVNLYCMLVNDEVEREIIEDSEVDFGEEPDNIEITLEDGTKDKLQGGDAEVTIKIENARPTTSGMVIPSAVQNFTKSSFFNVDLIAVIDGSSKKVTELTQKATIVLPLPDDYVNGDIKVLNYHDGYDKAPIVLGTTVNKTEGTVTFTTDKFSPYVMMYDEDDSVEMDSVDVWIQWDGDSKDKTGRVDIELTDTVTYENGATYVANAEYIATTSEDKTKVTFAYPKTLGGSAFKSHRFINAFDIDVDGYNVRFDSGTYTYTLSYLGSTNKEIVSVTIDLSGFSDKDFTEYVNNILANGGTTNVTLEWNYDDNTSGLNTAAYAPNLNTKVYHVDIEVTKQKYSGARFKEYTNIKAINWSHGNYENVVDTDNLKLSFRAVAVDSAEKTKYNFVVKVVDNSNAGKTRPDKLYIDFIATYGDYTRNKGVEVDLVGINGNTANSYVEFPTTVGGVAMTKLDATTSTSASKYSSTWDSSKMIFKYILDGASDTEPDPDPVVNIDPVNAYVTFVGDAATTRPQKVIITAVDSNNQNAVVKEIDTVYAANTNTYTGSVQRLVDDTYHIQSVSGVDGTKYKVEYSGMTVTLTYTAGGSTTPVTPSSTREVTITIDDSNNEDGLRPKTMTITVANDSGSESVTNEVTIGSENTFKYKVNVSSATDNYTVKSVSGLPSSYTTTINGLSVTCKHTVEKISKTYKVAWSDDGDNVDNTRPNTVQLSIKNSDTTVQTVTVSADTNWTANAELNKYIKGVEASYSVEGADVTNYSKTTEGDTVTYKFTGTLSKNAVGADGASLEEISYDIANFDWIDYANKYPDLKKAYGYNKEALYAHYIHYGIGEGRIATFTGKYNTVSEDILAAYFPEDYKYKTDLTSTNPEYLIGVDQTTSTSTVSSATTSGNKVTVDGDGNVHTTVTNADGTVTETVTDADGNIISVSTYKTGDLRLEDMSTWFIILGVLMLVIAGILIGVVVKDNKRKKQVLSMIS